MLLKEIRDTLKQTGFIMVFLAVMPLVYLLDSSLYETGVTFSEYIVGGFALLWLIAAGYLAYNMFRPEEKDNAVEYILSLPITRWKLLIWKTAPRVLILLTLMVVVNSLSRTYLWFYNFTGLLAFIVFSQICGFALGLVGRKSWVARSMLFVMMICVFFINNMLPWFIWKNSVVVSSLLCILIEFGFLVLILVPLYRTWDLKPVRVRELSFAKRSLIPMILLAFPVVWMFSS